jgi:transcriptional regulator with XRE-family HTH domain
LVDVDHFPGRSHLSGMPLTPQQCRAARGLLGWTQEDLAERAGVSRSTVRGFEGGQHEPHRASAAVIRGALEAAGVILVEADEEAGPGVRLRRDGAPRPGPDPADAGRAPGEDSRPGDIPAPRGSVGR